MGSKKQPRSSGIPGALVKVVVGFTVGFALAMGLPLLPGWQPFNVAHQEQTQAAAAQPAHGEGHHGPDHHHGVHNPFAHHVGQRVNFHSGFGGTTQQHHLFGRGHAHHAHGIHGSSFALQRQPAGVLLRGSNTNPPPPPPPKAADPLPSLLSPPPAAIDPPRICGSPAVDGYAHVVPKCLEDSPTARMWGQWTRLGHQPSELSCSVELEADFDGLAVAWGPYNKKSSVEECMEACRAHKPGPNVGGPFTNLPCNSFTFCPFDECFEPDAHHHTKGDCWLKFTEAPQRPEMNMRGSLLGNLRERHAKAPLRTPWHGGVCLLPGMVATNGTWGPRYKW